MKSNGGINQLEKTLEFEETKIASKLADNSADTSRQANKLMGKKAGKGKSKIANKIVDKTEDRKILKLHEDINTLKSMAKNVTIDDTFIPNRLLHLDKWAKGLRATGAFTSDIEEHIIVSIIIK